MGLLVAISVTVVVAALWPKPPPQIITLASGDRLEFAGVNYGTNTEPPTFSARLVERLPQPLAHFIRQHAPGRFPQFGVIGYTSRPQLTVWFRVLANYASGGGPTLQFSPKLADQDGVEAGAWTRYGNGGQWFYVTFPVAPRRSPVIQCVLYPNTGGTNPVGRVSFRNPLFGHFPQWQPDSIPVVKMAGDLEVSLDDLAIEDGMNSVSMAKANRRPASQRGDHGQPAFTSYQLSLTPAPGKAEAWVLHSAEFDDATGNVLHQSVFSPPGWRPGDSAFGRRAGKTTSTYFVPGTLWPDESAWRLKLEVRRALGIDPSELVIFTNVPIPAPRTNCLFHLTNSANGVQIVLTELDRQQHSIQNGDSTVFVSNALLIELQGKTAGVALDAVDVTSNDGIPVSGIMYGSGSSYALDLTQIPANATNLNVSLVVQKTRSVEFLVKPPEGGTN